MTAIEAIDWVLAQSDEDEFETWELEEVFAAIYGRSPDDDDRAEGLWSHCCAALPR